MPAEPPAPAADRAAAALMADLLEQGRVIHLLAVALCAAAAAALLLAPGWTAGLIPALVLLAGLGETWMALRVGFDARCFRRIAEDRDGSGLEGFDLALGRLGLMPPAKAGRPMAVRLAGGRHLLIIQGAVLALQAGLVLLALLAASHRTGMLP